MKFSILSIHPQLAAGFFSDGLLAKAVQKGILKIQVVNIRDFSAEPHHRVDDKPYGGGPGMVMKPEPIVGAIRSVVVQGEKTRIIVLSAKGKSFTQTTAKRLQKKYDHLVFICGRYEGIDERVADYFADEELNVGRYILMGGEVGAAAIVEAVGRLVPGVLGNSESLNAESFSEVFEFEYEQYTRPREFEGHQVPEILVNGDHRKILAWRGESSKPKVHPTLKTRSK